MAKKPKQPEKPKPDCLQIDGRYLKEGEAAKYKGASEAEIAAFTAELAARALSQPEVRAALAIQYFEGDTLDVNACADELRRQVAEVQRGDLKRAEALLVAQAHTLDAMFSKLAMRSLANSRGGYLEAADRYMRLALKAQSQCRATAEALATIKNPPIVYARQANIANGPQQVNNGISSRTGENVIDQSKQSEVSHELLQDRGTPALAGRVDPQMETLGEIHRAEVERG